MTSLLKSLLKILIVVEVFYFYLLNYLSKEINTDF